MSALRVYTDGACSGTPGPGGWAWAVSTTDALTLHDSGHERSTTNQRMEMRAVLEALRTFTGHRDGLTIVSDSAYVVNCFHQRWYVRWQDNGWRTSGKKPVANRDLWEPMIPLAVDVTFEHVRGHAGDYMNEMVDKLAVAAKHAGMGKNK